MKALPLYPTQPPSIFDTTPARPLDSGCTACALHEEAKSVCLRPEGDAGGVYVIGVAPGMQEDRYGGGGRPWVGLTAARVRKIISDTWSGPVAYDYAIRCFPAGKKKKLTSKLVDACRPHTSRVLFDVAPQRILAFGLEATESVLGRRVSGIFARRGYGWHFDEEGNAIPVFVMPTPEAMLRNKFLSEQLTSDIQWALTCPIPATTFAGVTMLVETVDDAEIAYDALIEEESFTYDVETHGKHFNNDFYISALTMLGLDADVSYTFTREVMRESRVRELLKKLLENASIGKDGQNIKYDDVSSYCAFGATVSATDIDTRLIRKLGDPLADASLSTLAELIGMGGHKEEAEGALDKIVAEMNRLAAPEPGPTKTGKVRAKRKQIVDIDVPEKTLERIREGTDPKAYAYDYLPEDILYRYNARDVWTTRAVRNTQVKSMEPHVSKMWRQITRDASVAVRHIEAWGIGCDRDVVRSFSTYCRFRLSDAREKIASIAGNDFNPASPKQLEVLLFDKLKLPSRKVTDSGSRSTDKEVLEKLRGRHPIIEALLEFRKYEKLDGTYATGMLPHIRDDGRIHPSFLLDGTDTGRMSARDPNLQNIPRAQGDEHASLARNCFVAPPGYVLLELDFSQIELRIAALLSGDKEMTSDFKRKIDIHRNNARACCRIVWGVDQAVWDSWSKEQQDPYRSKIKTATFGRLYGKSPGALAREWGVDVKEVLAIDAAIWGRYSTLDAWTKSCVKESRRTGVTWTWWKGERALCRPIPKIVDPDDGSREHAERQSYNTAVQGTSALYTNASLMPIVRWILQNKIPAKVVCTVHDSIMLEVREDRVLEVAQKCREIMTSHSSGDVPLAVDAKYGYAWGSMSNEIKFAV